MVKWKKIKGYGGKYEISSDGRIKSYAQTNPMPLILKPTPAGDHKQYLSVNLWKDNKRYGYLLHTLYAETFGCSTKEAMRICYAGFHGDPASKYNVQRWLMEKIMECESSGSDTYHDEILYLKEFLSML